MRRRAALPLERKAAFPGHNPLVPVYLADGFYKKLYTFPKTTGMKNNEHVIIKERIQLGIQLKQNYVNEENVLCYNCVHYGVLTFAPGMPEIRSCQVYGDIDPDMLTGERNKCDHFEPRKGTEY